MPVTKASEIDSKFIKKIEDQYGEVDMVNDYFDLEDSVYYKTVDINKETGGIKHRLIQLPSFGESLNLKHPMPFVKLQNLVADTHL